MKLKWDDHGYEAKLPDGSSIYVRLQTWVDMGEEHSGWVVAVDKPEEMRKGPVPWTGPNARFAWRTRRIGARSYGTREAAVVAAEEWAFKAFPMHALAEVADE